MAWIRLLLSTFYVRPNSNAIGKLALGVVGRNYPTVKIALTREGARLPTSAVRMAFVVPVEGKLFRFEKKAFSFFLRSLTVGGGS